MYSKINKLLILFLFSLSVMSMNVFAKPEMTKKEGHISPFTVKITYLDDETREAMVSGIGYSSSYSHKIKAYGKGKSTVEMWIDTISMIKDISGSEAVFVFKNGKERTLKVHASYRHLFIANEDDGSERLALKDIKSVEFLHTPRKDKDDNAMFDLWKYSPYTGEKLN